MNEFPACGLFTVNDFTYEKLTSEILIEPSGFKIVNCLSGDSDKSTLKP